MVWAGAFAKMDWCVRQSGLAHLPKRHGAIDKMGRPPTLVSSIPIIKCVRVSFLTLFEETLQVVRLNVALSAFLLSGANVNCCYFDVRIVSWL